MKIAIVGGGWTGLSAAVEFARHGVPATILESARQLGGRARAVRFGPFHVDNGQHIMLGAFRSMLATLRTLGVSERCERCGGRFAWRRSMRRRPRRLCARWILRHAAGDLQPPAAKG